MKQPELLLTRSVRLPDQLCVARSERAPELGPRMLFFSGGSALRPLSHVLKRYTHNSIHLITPFDSGGSSASLRRAFGMLSIGDLRNRLLALADETVRGNPEIYKLFAHRLPKDRSARDLALQLEQMVAGTHPLMEAVPDPLQRLVRTQLRYFAERRPADFDLRGANIGNLLLAGGYLSNDRDVQSVLFLFSKLLEVRGIVHPVTTEDFHLAAELESGEHVFGQHLLTGKEVPPLAAAVRRLYLVDSLETRQPVNAEASQKATKWIRRADLICYPMGSFYTSVVANLLPRGVGHAIAATRTPKVYVPNTGKDPEQIRMTLSESVQELLRPLQVDAPEAEPSDLLDIVLIDSRGAHYELELDVPQVEALGVRVVDLNLTRPEGAPALDPQMLTEVLLSLS